MEIENQYPIGTFQPATFSEEIKNQSLAAIQFLPHALEAAITNLNEDQLQTPYREGGWTVHQLVHHVADSHINAYTRFKLGLTEENPIIKPYNEKAWVQLNDVKNLPVNISITLLFALHARWFAALQNLMDDDWHRCLIHPEHLGKLPLSHYVQLYAWHGNHHVAQINYLREKKKWNQ